MQTDPQIPRLQARVKELQNELNEANKQWHILAKRDVAFQKLLNDLYELKVEVQELNEGKSVIYIFSQQNGREINRNASITEGYKHTINMIRRNNR